LEGRLVSGAPWLRLETDAFRLTSGQSLTVTAVAEPGGLSTVAEPIEKAQIGQIQITTLTETRNLPVYMSVQKVWYSGWPRVRAWLAYGLLVLIGYLGAVVPLSAGLAVLLGWPRPEDATIGALVAGLILSPAGFYLSHRWVPQLDEAEDFHHRGSLAGELFPSRFAGEKLAWLTAAGAVVGALLGWRFAGLRPDESMAAWVLVGSLVGAIAGGLLAAEGEPSPRLPSDPPWLTQVWRGATLAASPTCAVLRSLVLLLAGSTLGLMTGALISRQIEPEGAAIGALAGLLMSSESHRWLCARLRWLLAHARLGGWMIMGAYLAITALNLLRLGQAWAIAPEYGYLAFRFPGLPWLLWLALLTAAALLGAVGGLRAADGAGLQWAQARRTFLGLVGALAVASLPVYVVVAGLATALNSGPAGDWVTLLAVLVASAGMTWSVRARRAQVEKALRLGRSTAAQGIGWSKAALPAAVRRAWRALGVTVNWANLGKRLRLSSLRSRLSAPATITRLRSRWAPPTLVELSAAMTVPLAVGAVGTAVLIENTVAGIVVGLIVGLGTVALYALIVIGVVVVAVWGIRYLRSH